MMIQNHNKTKSAHLFYLISTIYFLDTSMACFTQSQALKAHMEIQAHVEKWQRQLTI